MNEIEKIIEILKDTDIYEFKWEIPNRKIFLTRPAQGRITETSLEVVLDNNESIKNETEISSSEIKTLQIKSIMVGTFYNGPIGKNKNSITKGSKIKRGEVLYIIEAMKVIKEIASEVNCEVIDIYVENGQPVEYGQLLLLVKEDYV
ncbi:hypothetical protein HZA55_06230 [Candidatus Poribacteria bacterium]|nr:hypothetical protein [Candidatus Poribacteria bacterium]